MDDVLEDFLGAWVSAINLNSGTKVKREEINQWDLQPYFPSLTQEEIFLPIKHERFWKNLEPIPNADTYVKRLIDECNQVCIVTASHYSVVNVKIEWLLAHYPFLSWEQVIIADNKQLIRGDVLVDDGPHNLIGGRYEKILFDVPHNWHFDEKSIGATRAKSWEEVYETIRKIQEGRFNGRKNNFIL
ncbi:MAG: hypothetical protein RR365_09040 [Bacteroides sp.]